MKRGRVISDPATCMVDGCWNVIDRRWRVCERCRSKLPKAIIATLATLRERCRLTPAKHPQDPTRENTPHYLYRRLWEEALVFLSTGRVGELAPWKAKPGSSWEWGPFSEAHDEAKQAKEKASR